MNREDAIEALTAKGRTRGQAEAFLDLLASAFRRRGWAEGEPLTEEQISERVDTMLAAHPDTREDR